MLFRGRWRWAPLNAPPSPLCRLQGLPPGRGHGAPPAAELKMAQTPHNRTRFWDVSLRSNGSFRDLQQMVPPPFASLRSPGAAICSTASTLYHVPYGFRPMSILRAPAEPPQNPHEPFDRKEMSHNRVLLWGVWCIFNSAAGGAPCSLPAGRPCGPHTGLGGAFEGTHRHLAGKSH